MTAEPDEPPTEPPPPEAPDDEIMAFFRAKQRRLGRDWQPDVFDYVLPFAILFPVICKRKAAEIRAAGGREKWCQLQDDLPSYETFRLCVKAEQYRYCAQPALDWLNNPNRAEYPGWKPKGNYAPRAFIELGEKFLNRFEPEPPPKYKDKGGKGSKDTTNSAGDLAGEVDTPGLILAEARLERAEGSLLKAASREKILKQRLHAMERHVMQCERLLRRHGIPVPKPPAIAEWLDTMGELEEEEEPPVTTRHPRAKKATRTGVGRKAGSSRKAARKAATPRVPLQISVQAAWTGESYDLDLLREIFATNRRALVFSMMRFLHPPVGDEPYYPEATEIIGAFDEIPWWSLDHMIVIDRDDEPRRVFRPKPEPEY